GDDITGLCCWHVVNGEVELGIRRVWICHPDIVDKVRHRPRVNSAGTFGENRNDAVTTAACPRRSLRKPTRPERLAYEPCACSCKRRCIFSMSFGPSDSGVPVKTHS